MSKTISYINFGYLYFNVSGALQVAKANSLVNDLDIDCLSFRVEGSEDVPVFINFLKNYPHLVDQDCLSGDIFSFIGDEGVKILSEFLVDDSIIVNLDLRGNDISDYGAELLADVLLSNSSLESLVLSENDIGNTGAKSLAQALCCTSTLRYLELDRNPNIGEEGFCHLMKALSVNDSIIPKGLIVDEKTWEKYGSQCSEYIFVKHKIGFKRNRTYF